MLRTFSGGLRWILLTLVLSAPAWAGLEEDLESKWLGAWVVTQTEIYSDCAGNYTNNEVHGELVQADAPVRFPVGELAQVAKVDVKRNRVDLLLDIQEPILYEYREGPFTLYQERTCEVELEVDVPGRSKEAGMETIEDRFGMVLERHLRMSEAQESPTWNGRERKPYPDDYEETLADYETWKVEQTNQLVSQKIDWAVDRAATMVAQAPSQQGWGQTVGTGMRTMTHNLRNAGCSALINGDYESFAARAPGNYSRYTAEAFYFGQRLAYYVITARKLQGCFAGPAGPSF